MQAVNGGLVVKDVATLLVEAVERGQERPPVAAPVDTAEAVVHSPHAGLEGDRTNA